jgi:hypothetical protein
MWPRGLAYCSACPSNAWRVGFAVYFYMLDIIANKFLRLPAANSKVVQSTGDLHNKIVILFFRISENVFDNATSFNPSNDMLNHNPDTCDETVVLLLFWCKLFPFGLLLRLKRLHTIWSIPLKACILIHTNVLRVCGVFFISNLFIMTLAFIGLAQIITKGKPPALPGDS